MAHAARSRRWRRRHQACVSESRPTEDGAALDGGVLNFVTHHGSPTPAPDAPLPAAAEHAAAVTGAIVSPVTVRCRRCAAPLPPWVRQGFLRHGMRRWPARVVQPNP
jgi:hypothetical protein